ncbi:hypothetical protein MHU86_17728 [Fragilaria crotonensis]|nr:hypothetical protein MHU86_17728 [Fragilaria crotonensis]
MPKRQGSLRQKKKVDALTAEEQAHINDRRNEEKRKLMAEMEKNKNKRAAAEEKASMDENFEDDEEDAEDTLANVDFASDEDDDDEMAEDENNFKKNSARQNAPKKHKVTPDISTSNFGMAKDIAGCHNNIFENDGKYQRRDKEDQFSKALSYRKAKTKNKPDIVQRIHTFVNHTLFKKLKFATNETMVTMAIKTAMMEFQMHEDKFKGFYNVYRSTMMDAINTKRGTCAQLGGNIVSAHLIWLDKCRIVSTDDVLGVRDFTADFYTLKEVSAMRNFATTREKCAFSGSLKTSLIVWLANLTTEIPNIWEPSLGISQLVMKHLLFYCLKIMWKSGMRLSDNCTKTEMTAKMPRMHGKYTSKKVGQAEFGGWSREGVRKFNINCMQIMADRLSDKGQAAEQELLTYLQGTPKDNLSCRNICVNRHVGQRWRLMKNMKMLGTKCDAINASCIRSISL